MSERSYNMKAMQAYSERVKQQQTDRASNTGVEGVSDLYISSNTNTLVRFLTPFTYGIEMLTHRVLSDDKYTTYICEHQFSEDPTTLCPICQDVEEMPDGETKGLMKVKKIRNFLVYVYNRENATFESNGTIKKSNTLAVLRIGPGDRNGKNWQALGTLAQTYAGLSNVDILINKTGKGLETTMTFAPQITPIRQPDGRFTTEILPFNFSKITSEIMQNLPQIPEEPGIIDPCNGAHIELVNAWGNFFIKAGRYRTVDDYTTPQVVYRPNQPPYQGTAPSYTPPQQVQMQPPTQYTQPQTQYIQQPVQMAPPQPQQYPPAYNMGQTQLQQVADQTAPTQQEPPKQEFPWQ